MLAAYNIGLTHRMGVQESLENASQTAFISTLDAGYRVTDEQMSITDVQAFESLTQELFLTYSTVNTAESDVQFSFEYLVSTEDGDYLTSAPELDMDTQVKGVITRVSVDGAEHMVRHVLDINSKE